MLNELLNEIEKLKEYENLYNSAVKDKREMSNLLFELMTEKYNNTPRIVRWAYFKDEWCNHCKGRYYCELEFPDDIGKPIESDTGWIPPKKGCGKFEWS